MRSDNHFCAFYMFSLLTPWCFSVLYSLKKFHFDRSSKLRYSWWHFGRCKASGWPPPPSSGDVLFSFFSLKLAWNQLTSDHQIPFRRGGPCRAGIRALPVRLMTVHWRLRRPLRRPAAAPSPRPLVSDTTRSCSKWIGCFCLAKKLSAQVREGRRTRNGWSSKMRRQTAQNSRRPEFNLPREHCGQLHWRGPTLSWAKKKVSMSNLHFVWSGFWLSPPQKTRRKSLS